MEGCDLTCVNRIAVIRHELSLSLTYYRLCETPVLEKKPERDNDRWKISDPTLRSGWRYF